MKPSPLRSIPVSASTFSTPRRSPHLRASSTSPSSTGRPTMDFTRQPGLARLPISRVVNLTSLMLVLLQNAGRLAQAQNLLSGDLLWYKLQVPVGYQVQLSLQLFQQASPELRHLFGLLQQRVARVDNPCKERLRERAREGRDVRRVEVHPDRFHGELHELAQDVARVPERQLQRERQRALQGVQRFAQRVNVDLAAEELTLLQHDHRAAVPREPPDLRPEDVLGDRPRLEFSGGHG